MNFICDYNMANSSKDNLNIRNVMQLKHYGYG